MDKLQKAIAGSREAERRLRGMKRLAGLARPAVGHMPFPGHRTVAAIRRISESRTGANGNSIAAGYGYGCG